MWSPWVRKEVLAVLTGVLVGCSTTPEPLQMRQFHLRETSVDEDEEEVVRAEKLYRLHGAVSQQEREERKGHYYTAEWEGPAGTEDLPVRIVLEYRQAATGSKILRKEQSFPAGRRGRAQFTINGPEYAQGGRVLAWRLRLYRGGDLAATRKSYLWD